jgi:hypothetical protein
VIEDLGRYSNKLKESVQRVFLNRDEIGRRRILEITDAYKTPCIVVVYWCGEVSGWPDYLKHLADVLMKFYKYTEIKNKPEGCTW